jgi:hypothetical protein
MPEDAQLKVEAWPIEKVIAYASNPRKRIPAAVDGQATSISFALCPSASRRRRRPVQQLPAPHRSDGPVRPRSEGASSVHAAPTTRILARAGTGPGARPVGVPNPPPQPSAALVFAQSALVARDK